MSNECYNPPQDSGCQQLGMRNCHLTALGRIREPANSKKVHLSGCYEQCDFPPDKTIKGEGLKQDYGGNGADNMKKKGLGGFSAENWCDTCFTDRTCNCKGKLSFLYPTISCNGTQNPYQLY